MRYLPVWFPCVVVAVAACGGEAPPGPSGSNVAVRVAPLNLAGVTNARYRLTVENAGGDTVAQVEIDADRYGDGAGSLSYVVPCDADSNDNEVTVEILDLFSGDPQVALADYRNPGPLTKPARCEANADVAVSFDIVVARQANQGFFDIAVELADVFCSAKLDCIRDGTPAANIDLLFNPGGARDTTVVLALACTGGVGSAAQTHLYLDDIGLDCDADAVDELILDPTAGPGNAYGAANPDPDLDDAVFQYAVFAGEEALTSGGSPAGKRYWNVSIGLDTDALGAGCRLRTRATASEGALAGNAPPADTTYPVITYDVLLSADGNGVMQCGHNPVNGAGSGVTTAYVAASPAPEAFDAAYASATGLQRTLLNLPASCTAVLERDSDAISGTYNVDPDGDAGPVAPLEVYCDMDLIVGQALTLVLKRPVGTEGTSSAGFGVPADAAYKLPTASIMALHASSEAWIVAGLASGEIVQLPTGVNLPSINGPNTYDNLAGTAIGVGFAGCGPNVWGSDGFEVLTGLPSGSRCYAYPTTANFYDFSTSQSFDNDGGAWVYLRGTPGLGLGRGNPAPSCLAIKDADAAAPSASYWIDPNGGTTTDAFAVWCDMDFDGGGWTLVVKHTSDGLPFTTAAQNLGDMAAAPVTSDAKVADASINAASWTEWRIEVAGDAARHIVSQSGLQFNVAWTTQYVSWPSGSADNGRNQTWCYVAVPTYGTQCYAIGTTNTYGVAPHEAGDGGTWVHAPHATAGPNPIGGFSCGFGSAAESNCTITTGLAIRHWVR